MVCAVSFNRGSVSCDVTLLGSDTSERDVFMEMPPTAAAAWRAALAQCLRTQSHGLVDGSIALLYVDASRVFHAAQSLVRCQDAGEDAAPLVVVMRLHPRITALLQLIEKGGAARPDEVSAIVESLVFQENATATTGDGIAASAAAAALSSAPPFARRAVNVAGGALVLYGPTEQSASEALTMVTMALTSGDGVDESVLSTELDRFSVMVEFSDGYLGREYVLSEELAVDAPPRLYRIERREWSSASVAGLTLDDALEEFEEAFEEDRAVRGVAQERHGQSLSVEVKAAFEVSDQSRSALTAAFLLDRDSTRPKSASAGFLPPVALFSKWQGLENVRSLLCKPPPQSAAALCFASDGDTRKFGSRQSLTLLENLELATREGSSHRSWGISATSESSGEITTAFKQLLKNIDQDDLGMDDTNTNTNFESTVSMALDGEQERSQGATRPGVDPIEKVWEFFARHVDGIDRLIQLLQELLVHLSNTRIFPAPQPENDTYLGHLVRLRHDEIQGNTPSPSFATSARELLAQPSQVVAYVIEAGEWKMKRDVAYWLAQTGFSSQECEEFVRAMPRFDVKSRSATHVHWKAMDRVLQLCSHGRSIQLPVAFMRKAVHDCVAFYAHRTNTGTPGEPVVLIDLQSFIPERLRANIADMLFWDFRIAFNADFEHRLRVCQDTYHPTTLKTSDALSLSDHTLRALHRSTPERVLLLPEVVQFISKLEDDNEKRLYEQLHGMEMPTGMTRYDCSVRRLYVFP